MTPGTPQDGQSEARHGECMPSDTYIYEEGERGELVIEMWNRDFPATFDEPRINVTATDVERSDTATTGLEYEQVRALHHVLGRWLDANA